MKPIIALLLLNMAQTFDQPQAYISIPKAIAIPKPQ